MHKTKISFKNFFQKTDASGLSVMGRGQVFDWEMLLTIFFIILVGVVAYGVYVFLGVRSGDIFQVDQKTIAPSTLLNKSSLDSAISDFTKRADNLKSLQAKHPVLVDPSL